MAHDLQINKPVSQPGERRRKQQRERQEPSKLSSFGHG
jgi:hypothetical protein